MVEPDGALQALVRLHRVVTDVEHVDTALQRVVDLCLFAVPACQEASVTTQADTLPVTVAHSGASVELLDDAQYEGDGGPCLEAARTGTIVLVDSIPQEDRWPIFRDAALEAGLHSSLSVPLVSGDSVLGSVNMYGRPVGGFDEDSQAMARLFAEQVAIALANVVHTLELHGLIDQLGEAIESRDVIGQAKGILMAQRRVSADEAFDMLRSASQGLNRKLREVAEDVARTGALPTD